MAEEILDVAKLLEERDEEIDNLAPVFEFDMGNLLVIDNQEQQKGFSIPDQARACIQELFTQVFNLPVTASEEGPLVNLPKPILRIPREKAPPQPKIATKWEEFAKEKGIKKRKKSRMVWDDIAKEYRPRWGKDRPLDPKNDWVLPDKPIQLEKHGVEDPFALNKKKAKDAKEKQHKAELANKRRADRARQKDSGTPTTLSLVNTPKREKYVLERAVGVAQKSTASMGKFDKVAVGEPKIKKKPVMLPSDTSKEREITNKIVSHMLKKQDKMDLNKAANLEMAREQTTKKRNAPPAKPGKGPKTKKVRKS